MVREEVLKKLENLSLLFEEENAVQKRLDEVIQQRIELHEQDRILENDIYKHMEKILEDSFISARKIYGKRLYDGFEWREYYLGNIEIAKSRRALENHVNEDWFAASLDFINAVEALKALENISEEEKKMIIMTKIEQSLEKRNKQNEQLNARLEDEEELLTILCAERAVLPWHAFARKNEIEKKISVSEKNIQEITEKLNENYKALASLNEKKDSNECGDEMLAQLNEFIARLKQVCEWKKQYEINLDEFQKFTKNIKELQEQADQLNVEKYRVVDHLTGNPDETLELIEISRDSKLPKQIRKLASKILSFDEKKLINKVNTSNRR